MSSRPARYVPPHQRGKEHAKKRPAAQRELPHNALYSPLLVESEPSESYLAIAQDAPSRYTSISRLPLLVLGTNGTLMHRRIRRCPSKASARPFLGTFLAYATGVQASHNHTFSQRAQLWHRWDSERASCIDAPVIHGSSYWPLIGRERVEPFPTSMAHYRPLIWSGVLDKNLELMLRARFAPEQAQQLLRIYGRNTLMPDQWLACKARSCKDLVIVWQALSNSSDHGDKQEAEKRVLAQYRLDHPDTARLTASHRRPSSVDDGFSQFNTIAFEDSPDKARLQPFNYVLVPEFDSERAAVFVSWRKTAREAKRQGLPVTSPPSDLDDVLLQAVGVLSHARWQRNISAWIRSGGLGFFGGLKHPGVEAEEPVASDDRSTGASIDDAAQPRLDTPVEQKTQHFWAQEGRRALKLAGIPCEIDSYHHI